MIESQLNITLNGTFKLIRYLVQLLSHYLSEVYRWVDYQNKWNLIRDIMFCVVGVLLTINEAVFHHGQVKVELLTLYAGMMGVPFVLKADARRRERNSGDKNDKD